MWRQTNKSIENPIIGIQWTVVSTAYGRDSFLYAYQGYSVQVLTISNNIRTKAL